MRQERLGKIEEFVSKCGFVTMEQIRDEFQIAMPTVRKDISELASQGLIEKVYGGAKAVTKGSSHMHKFKNRESVRVQEKNTIAAKAAGLVDDGDVIYLDAGTTVASVINYIGDKHVTVITSNLAAINAIAETENIDVYIIGGKFNKDTMSVDNASACELIGGYNIDKAFMAATGYSIEGGIAQDSATECEIKRYALEWATESYLLIDSSKIGKKALIRYAEPDSIKTIVTDGAYDGEYKKYFKENGINIV